MTTESMTTHRPGARVLLGAGVAGLVVVGAATGIAAATHGGDAALAALVGGGATLVVLLLGTAAVHVVSTALPGASMLVALLTYALQLLAMIALVTTLADTSVAASDAARGWFAAGVVTTTVGWLVVQVRLATTLRIPAFEAGAR